MDSPPPSRRWWKRSPIRLSVRSLMGLVLIVGVAIGWPVSRAHIQRDAVAAIRRAGGLVVYSRPWPDGHPPQRKPAMRGASGWLRDRLGPDYFDRVVAVKFSRSPGYQIDDELMAHIGRLGGLEELHLKWCPGVTDGRLARVRGLTGLRVLDLVPTGVTAVGMVHLRGLTGLERLDLPTFPIPDAELAHLAGLTKLKWLQLGGIRPAGPVAGMADLEGAEDITDAGMAHLEGMVDLEFLGIHSPRLTSAGLDALRGMARLRRLNLGSTGVADLAPIGDLTGLTSINLTSTPVDDAGLARITSQPNLTHLTLDGTRITDAGLVHLSGLHGLAELSLEGTRVTDAGLPALAALKNCRRVRVRGTDITPDGIESMKAVMPAMQILR